MYLYADHDINSMAEVYEWMGGLTRCRLIMMHNNYNVGMNSVKPRRSHTYIHCTIMHGSIEIREAMYLCNDKIPVHGEPPITCMAMHSTIIVFQPMHSAVISLRIRYL